MVSAGSWSLSLNFAPWVMRHCLASSPAFLMMAVWLEIEEVLAEAEGWEGVRDGLTVAFGIAGNASKESDARD